MSIFYLSQAKPNPSGDTLTLGLISNSRWLNKKQVCKSVQRHQFFNLMRIMIIF